MRIIYFTVDYYKVPTKRCKDYYKCSCNTFADIYSVIGYLCLAYTIKVNIFYIGWDYNVPRTAKGIIDLESTHEDFKKIKEWQV